MEDPRRVEKCISEFEEFTGPITFAKKTKDEAILYENGAKDSIDVYANYTPGKAGSDRNLMIDSDGTMLDGADDFIVIVNGEMPFTEWYPPEKQSSAGMSFVHLLAIPRKPIYNGVTLKKEHIPMLNKMKECVITILNESKVRIVEHILKSTDFRQNKNYKPIYDQKIDMYCKAKIQFMYPKVRITEDDVEFAFHMFPNHSIPQLHMHCILLQVRDNTGKVYDMRTGGYKIHAHKNMPVSKVIEYLNGQSGGSGGSRKPYDKRTVTELRALASKRKIKGSSKMKKSELVSALRGSR
jgi:hypothetical protein